MKKSKFEYTKLENVVIYTAICTMPILALLLMDTDSNECVLYLGLWMSIMFGFAVVHIKLSKYYELIFGKEEEENGN